MDLPLPNIFDFIPFLVSNAFWVLLGVAIIVVVTAVDWLYHQINDRLPRTHQTEDKPDWMRRE